MQFSSLLFEVKFSVFLKEKMTLPGFLAPETGQELTALCEDFRTWVKHTDVSVADEALERFLSSVDREAVAKWYRKLCASGPSREQTPTWMQMSLKRDKAKLAMDIHPVGKK